MKYGVFISYSHEDSSLIAPVVALIKTLRKDLVFHDVQDINAGKLWEPQLNKALMDANLVIVFWCKHSAVSDYVEKEYKFAIENTKDILPLLLDDSKLPGVLSAYQYIDVSKSISHPEAAKQLDAYTMSKKIAWTTLRGIIFPWTTVTAGVDQILALAIHESLKEKIPPK